MASLRARAGAAVAFGLAGAAYTLARFVERGSVFDFHQPWLAARAVLSGVDPFVVVRSSGEFPLIYPMTSVVLALPFGALPEPWGTAAFAGLGVGALSFGLMRRGWWALMLLFSIPVITAVQLGQWSPLLTGTALAAGPGVALGVAIAGKPTIGLSLLAAFPTRRVALGLAAVAGVSLALSPAWPMKWLAAIAAGGGHLEPPVVRPGGVILLLALIRWKRPEARMLAVLSLIPQTRVAYEAVLLLLIPQRAIEAIILLVGSWWTVIAWQVVPIVVEGEMQDWLAYVWPALLIGTYLPMLYLVLRRPNEGEVPLWVRRFNRESR